MRWRAIWLATAPLLLGASAPDAPMIDHIVVHKGLRVMELWAGGQMVRKIAGLQLGPAPIGPKHFARDGRTPEGHYTIDYGNPASAYHLSLHISYPSAADVAYAAAQGRAPGGDIFIHGAPNDTAQRPDGDWTAGCIAVSNAEIEDLWQGVGDGTPIDITA